MIESCQTGLGWTTEELLLIRTAIEAGLLGTVTLGLAYVVRLLRRWWISEQ